MATLKAIRNHVIFQFEDEHQKHMGIAQFKEKTDWGFEFAETNASMEVGRWVRITHVGHEVPDDIQPGMRVCVDKLCWTNAFEVDGENYWRTDSDSILLIDEGA